MPFTVRSFLSFFSGSKTWRDGRHLKIRSKAFAFSGRILDCLTHCINCSGSSIKHWITTERSSIRLETDWAFCICLPNCVGERFIQSCKQSAKWFIATDSAHICKWQILKDKLNSSSQSNWRTWVGFITFKHELSETELVSEISRSWNVAF
jgi:hypothetical protein